MKYIVYSLLFICCHSISIILFCPWTNNPVLRKPESIWLDARQLHVSLTTFPIFHVKQGNFFRFSSECLFKIIFFWNFEPKYQKQDDLEGEFVRDYHFAWLQDASHQFQTYHHCPHSTIGILSVRYKESIVLNKEWYL